MKKKIARKLSFKLCTNSKDFILFFFRNILDTNSIRLKTFSHFHHHHFSFFHDKLTFSQKYINVASRRKHQTIFVSLFSSSFFLSFSFFFRFFFSRFLSIDDNFNQHRHFQQFNSFQDIDIFHNDSQMIVQDSVCDVNRRHLFIETSQSKTKEEIVVVVVVVIFVIIVRIAHDNMKHKTFVF